MISRCRGFSFAVSGMYRPPRISSVSSRVSSSGRTTTRSARGWILILDFVGLIGFVEPVIVLHRSSGKSLDRRGAGRLAPPVRTGACALVLRGDLVEGGVGNLVGLNLRRPLNHCD